MNISAEARFAKLCGKGCLMHQGTTSLIPIRAQDLAAIRVPAAVGQKTAATLQQWGFQRTCNVFTTWTQQDLSLLAQGVDAWRSRNSQDATYKMKPLTFLSHHIMSKRFNEKSCLFGLKLLMRKAQKAHLNPLDSIAQQTFVGSDGESDDELPLVGNEYGEV
jgi:hypothetical protein